MAGLARAQVPAIPEPPVILYGTVTDKANHQPVTITSVTWQVTDGTTTRGYSATTLPATRIVSNGQSFYLLEIPHETRIVRNSSGQITLQPGSNGFELKSPPPVYTLTATINGGAATVKAVDSTPQPSATASTSITDYTPATQGRMMRVDLWINEDPYLTWAAGYFPNTGSPEAAPDADPDGDGASNRQELAAGTNPIDTRIRFARTNSAVQENGTLLIEASTIPGKRYQLEGSSDLVTFTSIGPPFAATALRSQLSATPGTNHHFFRIKTLPD